MVIHFVVRKIPKIPSAAEGQRVFQTSTAPFWVGRLVLCSLSVPADRFVYSLFTDDLLISFEAYIELPQFTCNGC